MEYPLPLLPKSNYNFITELDSGGLLLRRIENIELIHHSTGLLKDEAIISIDAGDKQILDYSTNLLGQFKVRDLGISFNGDKKRYFIAVWIEGENVDTPIFEQDFVHSMDYKFFCLPIDAIHRKLKVPFMKGEKSDFEAIACVTHVPTNANFWHFEIHWKDQHGEKIKPESKPQWRKNLASSIKAAIKQYCRTVVPSPHPEFREQFFLKNQKE